ncbi:MAG: hypothetical protein H7223_09215 [Pedobacter sp.]|nr:hypothetical protein [Pedobacter sp.]
MVSTANINLGYMLMKRPEIAYAFNSFKVDYPQLQLEINDEKADGIGR